MPRRFASTTNNAVESTMERTKQQRTERRSASSTPIVGPRDYQSRQTFPAVLWAVGDQQNILWDPNIVNAGAIVSSGISSHDFTNHEHDDVSGGWTITASFTPPTNDTADFAWAVPFQKFADYVRVGIRILINSAHPTATAPDEIIDNLYLGFNQYGNASSTLATKTDIVSDLAAFDTWYYVYIDHAGDNISAKTEGMRAWVEVVSKRYDGEEPVDPYNYTVYIEHITVDQWNLYKTII